MSKLKHVFDIKPIPSTLAIEYVIKYHYLHRKPNVQKAFGMYNRNTQELVGVITYGHCASLQLRNNMFGADEKDNIYELTRLWIKDDTPKNSESFFIGNTLKLLDKEIIISFADPQQNHNGTIYQACNFYYTGLSHKSKNLHIKGKEEFHKSNFNIEGTVKELREKYGEENVYYLDRERKHRYFYLNCNTKRKNILLKKLKYEIRPYPQRIPMNIIYGLYDPPDLGGKLRYVGQSSIGLERAWQHKKISQLKAHSHKIHWIKSLLAQDKMYNVDILYDLGFIENKNDRDNLLNLHEIRIIAEQRNMGTILTNSTDGGEGTRGNILREESKRLISEKRQKWLKENDLPKSMWDTCYKRKEYKIIDDIPNKHCSDCDTYKKFNEFGKDKNQWDKIRTICIACSRIRKEAYYYKTRVVLSEEDLQLSYITRKEAMSTGVKTRYETDPEYRKKNSKAKSKPVVGINVTNPQDIIEFESALVAYKTAKFSNTYISIAIKTGKPYKGYYWSFKL